MVGAAEVLPVSFNFPLPLRRTHPPTLVCCFCVFAAMGVTSTKSGRLEVNLSLPGKRGGKSHLGTILLSAVSETWRFCMVIRSLLPISMETMHGPKEPVFLIALRIMRHAMLSFGDHVPYLRVLAPRKDVQGTVYVWAEGASLTC